MQLAKGGGFHGQNSCLSVDQHCNCPESTAERHHSAEGSMHDSVCIQSTYAYATHTAEGNMLKGIMQQEGNVMS